MRLNLRHQVVQEMLHSFKDCVVSNIKAFRFDAEYVFQIVFSCSYYMPRLDPYNLLGMARDRARYIVFNTFVFFCINQANVAIENLV